MLQCSGHGIYLFFFFFLLGSIFSHIKYFDLFPQKEMRQMRGSLYVSKLRGPQPFPHQNFLISHIFYNKKKDTIRALLTDSDFRKVGLLSLSHINISYLLGKANSASQGRYRALPSRTQQKNWGTQKIIFSEYKLNI